MGNFDSASDSVKISDLMGKLVLITPTEHLSDVQTADYGPKDPILADIVVFKDGAKYPDEYQDSMIFQGQLISKIKRSLPVTDANGVVVSAGRNLLGVVGLGAEKKKGNFPFVLLTPSPEQRKLVEDWFVNGGGSTRAAKVGDHLPWVTESARSTATAYAVQSPAEAAAPSAYVAPAQTGFTPSADDPWAAAQ